jgi:nuclear transport factor 2 (NTF2) superfamily protein
MVPDSGFDEPSQIDKLRAMYEAFNQRDADRVLNAMTADVDWPNGWQGGRVTGQDAVREYWRRQWAEIDPKVTPIHFTALPDDRVRVRVHQVVHDRNGNLLADTQVGHVYSFKGGLINSMEIEEG